MAVNDVCNWRHHCVISVQGLVMRPLLIALFLSLVAFSFVPSVHAADYYWQLTNYSKHYRGDTPGASCDAFVAARQSDGSLDVKFKSLDMVSPTRYACVTEYKYKSHTKWSTGTNYTNRFGDACPAGSALNATTGLCEPDCSDKAGNNTAWATTIPGFASTQQHGIGEYGCDSSCRVQLGSFTCSAATDGRDEGYCIGMGQHTGTSCQAGDTALGSANGGPTDPPPPTDPGCPPPLVWNGNFCQEMPPPTCVEPYVLDENNQCSLPPDNPPPDPDDGTGDPGDPGDGDGGSSGGGSGDSGGDGGGSGDSGGSGDGSGDGDGTGDGSGSGGGAGSGEGEDPPPECEGPDCSEEPAPLIPAEIGEVGEFGDTTQAYFDRIKGAPLFAAIGGIGAIGSGSCSFPTAQTEIGAIDLNIMCDLASGFLSPLYFVFLALFAFAAVRVLLSA